MRRYGTTSYDDSSACFNNNSFGPVLIDKYILGLAARELPVIILTYFFFQGNQSTWWNRNINDPAPYDMFTSIQINLGAIKQGFLEMNYLSEKKDCLEIRRN